MEGTTKDPIRAALDGDAANATAMLVATAEMYERGGIQITAELLCAHARQSAVASGEGERFEAALAKLRGGK